MKTFTGKVISTKMPKVATVLIERYYRHPLYGKILKRNIKIHAANGIGAKVGETVIIIEVRPIAKTVSFSVKKIVGKRVEEEKKAVEKKQKELKKKAGKPTKKIKITK